MQVKLEHSFETEKTCKLTFGFELGTAVHDSEKAVDRRPRLYGDAGQHVRVANSLDQLNSLFYIVNCFEMEYKLTGPG